MKLSDLKIADSKKDRKRVGRGISAGGGKTAGRGTKGQNSRSGAKRNPGFEGGQNPLFHRIPKRGGFTSRRTAAMIVKTSQLGTIKASTITHKDLVQAGLINNDRQAVKLLLDEAVSKKISVQLDGASQSAIDSIVKAGGTFKSVSFRTNTVKATKS